MQHMNMTQRGSWMLISQGYDVIYPKNNSDLLLLKSQLLKNASVFSSTERRVAERIYHAPALVKMASQKDDLKSKLYKAVLTDMAEKEAKKIKGEARKGLDLIKKAKGFKDPFDIQKMSQKPDEKDPLYRMLKERLQGATSPSQISNAIGLLCVAQRKGDIQKMAQILGVDEKTVWFLLLSENGTKDPMDIFRSEIKNIASSGGFNQKRAFMGKDLPSLEISWKDFFGKKAYTEIWKFFSEGIPGWFDPVELIEIDVGDAIIQPFVTIEILKENASILFWNKVRAAPGAYLDYVKGFFLKLTELLGDILVAIWEADWTKLREDFKVLGPALLLVVSIYLAFLAMAHFQLWLLELPRNLLVVWPLKISLWLYKKIALGAWKLGKAAYTFLSQEEARDAFYQFMREKYDWVKDSYFSAVDFFKNFSFEELFKEKEEEYLEDPNALLMQMV